MEQSQQSQESRLCSVCSTFYGTQQTNYLCSSCHKQQAKDSMPSSNQLPTSQQASVEVSAAPVIEETKAEEPVKVQTDCNKCWNCNKKVGLVKLPCKCGYVYCPKHRHAESHNCTFDYFAQQQEKLAKENPLIQKDKIEKIY